MVQNRKQKKNRKKNWTKFRIVSLGLLRQANDSCWSTVHKKKLVMNSVNCISFTQRRPSFRLFPSTNTAQHDWFQVFFLIYYISLFSFCYFHFVSFLCPCCCSRACGTIRFTPSTIHTQRDVLRYVVRWIRVRFDAFTLVSIQLAAEWQLFCAPYNKRFFLWIFFLLRVREANRIHQQKCILFRGLFIISGGSRFCVVDFVIFLFKSMC